MAQALGFRLLDAAGDELPPGGVALARLSRVDRSGARPELAQCRVLAATDVRNPLCGPDGASAVYGPQKGADTAAIAELDEALRHFGGIVKRDLGVDVLDLPGAGAAGGLGAGAVAFLDATLRSGAEVVGEAARLPERILDADIVVTGEGRLDGQTPFGKAPAYVARLARDAKRPVACLAGSFGPGHEAALPLFDAVEVAGEEGGVPAAEDARRLLAEAAVRAVRRLAARR
jgi:glycerate kinase